MSYHRSPRAKPNDKLPDRSRKAMSRYGRLSLGFARGERWYDIGLSVAVGYGEVEFPTLYIRVIHVAAREAQVKRVKTRSNVG